MLSCFMPAKRRAHRARGFTLIEVMIVVAIVGILAAIAYPSYTAQIAKGRRSDAQTMLMEAAQYMQRYYAANNSFEDASLPAAYTKVPKGAADGSQTHDISVTVGDDNRTYELTAAPSDKYPDSVCGDLSLTDTGEKKASDGSVSTCWR